MPIKLEGYTINRNRVEKIIIYFYLSPVDKNRYNIILNNLMDNCQREYNVDPIIVIHKTSDPSSTISPVVYTHPADDTYYSAQIQEQILREFDLLYNKQKETEDEFRTTHWVYKQT